MKTERPIIYFFLAVVIAAMGVAGSPQGVRAQSCDPASGACPPTDTAGPTCGLPGLPDCAPNPPANNPPTATPRPRPLPTHTHTPTVTTTATPLPCNSAGSSTSARPDCTPTPTPPCISGGSGLSARPDCSPTPTPPCISGGSGLSARPDCSPTPTPKNQALIIPGSGTGPANPNGLLPAIQNLGPLGGGLLAGLIIVIVGLGSFFLVKRGRKLGSTSGSDLLPAIQRGGHESATIAVHDGADLGGGMESATMTVHDAGNVSPDGTMLPPGPPIRPSDVLMPPGPPVMPSDVLQPPGPPIMPSDVMLPPGPPVMPNDVLQPPGPPSSPNDALRPPGPPTKPPSPNLGGESGSEIS